MAERTRAKGVHAPGVPRCRAASGGSKPVRLCAGQSDAVHLQLLSTGAAPGRTHAQRAGVPPGAVRCSGAAGPAASAPKAHGCIGCFWLLRCMLGSPAECCGGGGGVAWVVWVSVWGVASVWVV